MEKFNFFDFTKRENYKIKIENFFIFLNKKKLFILKGEKFNFSSKNGKF